MAEHYVPLPVAGADVLPEYLPAIFRLTAYDHHPVTGNVIQFTASLFHEQASLRVTWTSRQLDSRLHVGALVSIRWLGRPTTFGGAIRISRLVLIEIPEASINLFSLVPSSWVPDRELVGQGKALVELLPRSFMHLFNAIFWDDHRFHRFLVGPSSMSGHHNGPNGNMRHSIEVAETALRLVDIHRRVCMPVLILGALLHDAGKADEYRYAGGNRFDMSSRGALLGHKLTVVEWIAAARARHRVVLPEAHYLSLLHALTAVKGAPDWVGMRQPQSMEASILSMADRLSGQHDLFERHAPAVEGFGRYHKHLRGRPFVVGDIRQGV